MNGNEDIEQLIARISRLTEREVSDLAVAWGSAERAVWKAGRAALGAALDAALGAALDAVLDAALDAALDTIANDRRGVWNAVLDAAVALEAKDLISEEHFNALYGPWGSVMDK